jgi:hypothetical protein
MSDTTPNIVDLNKNGKLDGSEILSVLTQEDSSNSYLPVHELVASAMIDLKAFIKNPGAIPTAKELEDRLNAYISKQAKLSEDEIEKTIQTTGEKVGLSSEMIQTYIDRERGLKKFADAFAKNFPQGIHIDPEDAVALYSHAVTQLGADLKEALEAKSSVISI